MADPFFDAINAKQNTGGPDNAFFRAIGQTTRRGRSLPDLQQRAAELEALQQATGAPAIEQESPGLFTRVLDLISRPNYAVAGFVEELGEGDSFEEGFARAGREMFSGLFGLEGDKRAFGQVLERLGVGPGITASQVLPFLYSETGEGLALERGGMLDITARGTAGLALDIFADPLTYITGGTSKAAMIGGKSPSKAGRLRRISEFKKLSNETIKLSADDIISAGRDVGRARIEVMERLANERVEAAIEAGATELLDKGGIKFMGATIPGTPAVATATTDVGKWVIDAIGTTKSGAVGIATAQQFQKKVLDPLGRMFQVAWDARKIPAYLNSRRNFLSKMTAEQTRWKNMIEASPIGDLARLGPDMEQKVVKLYQAGGVDAVRATFGDQSVQAKAMEFYKGKADEILATDRAAGFNVREKQNYFAQYYDNDFKAYTSNAELLQGKYNVVVGDLDRHLEDAVFESLEQAVEVSSKYNTMRPGVEVLRPIWSPGESLRRRGAKSIEAVSWKGWVGDLESKFGTAAFENINPGKLFELNIARNIPPHEVEQIERVLSSASRDIDDIGRMTKGGRQEYLDRRFQLVRTREELFNTMNKYERFMDDFPTRRSVQGLDDIDTLWRPIKVKGDRTVVLPEALHDDLVQIQKGIFQADELDNMLKVFDKLNNMWKTAVTVLFPAFHIRNAYSNVAQNFVDIGMGALDPKWHAEAVRLMSPGMRNGSVELGGRTYSRKQLYDIFEEKGIVIPGESLLEYTGNRQGQFTARGKLAQRLNPAEYGRKFGGSIENEARVQMALQQLRRGLTMDEAAERVNKFLFDYRNGLTRTEREFFKRVIPFYTWQSKNMRLMFSNLKKRPGLLAAELKPFRGREDENEMMTSWEAEALKLRLGGDGKTVSMLTGIDLPLRNLDMLWRGNFQRTAQGLAGMVTPLVKGPFEAATGVNLFLGREMTRKESGFIGRMAEGAPKPVRDWMGWKKRHDEAGRPRYSFDGNRFYLVFQSWMASRIVSTGDRVWREYMDTGDLNWQRALLDFGTGLRRKEMNLTEEQDRRLRERVRQLEQSLVRRGVLAEFSKTFTPKDQR